MRVATCLILIFLCLENGTPASAQQWSPQQREVWATLEEAARLYRAGNLEEYLAHLHPDYVDWYFGSAFPGGKDTVRRWSEHDILTRQIHLQESLPLAIQIFGDVAIVHSLWQEEWAPRGESGSRFARGRATNIFKLEDGRWLLIGAAFGPDMTGPYPYNP